MKLTNQLIIKYLSDKFKDKGVQFKLKKINNNFGTPRIFAYYNNRKRQIEHYENYNGHFGVERYRHQVKNFIQQVDINTTRRKKRVKVKNFQFIMLYVLLKPGSKQQQIRDALYQRANGLIPLSTVKTTSYPSYFSDFKAWGSTGHMNKYYQYLGDGVVLTRLGAEYLKRHDLLKRKDLVKPYVRP